MCHPENVDLDCPVHSPALNTWWFHDLLELELDCSPEVAVGETGFRYEHMEFYIKYKSQHVFAVKDLDQHHPTCSTWMTRDP